VRSFEAEEITVGEAGDLAAVRGSYRFTPDTLQPAQVQTGKFVGVWHRREGDWRLVINISNGDPP
jgi:ketosteroid isomerase-like protein